MKKEKRLRDELNERNEEIDILKGEASQQINQIRGSITKFLDKETGTLGDRIRTLFKEQGITIVSILTALGMTLGVLIEALLGILIEHLSFLLHDQRLELLYWFDLLIPNMHSLEPFQITFGFQV